MSCHRPESTPAFSSPRSRSIRSLSWRTSVLALGALLASCASPPPPPTVTIQRTTHGVAHIQAADLAGLAHGVAYAHAQDNLCQSADALLTARGERSRFLGGEASGLLGLRRFSNEDIDFFVTAHIDDAALAATWSREASADAQRLAQGYVAGYNHHLRDVLAAAARRPVAAASGQALAPDCLGQPWLRPMTLGDYLRLQELSMVQAGVGLLADAVLAARPPARGAAQLGQTEAGPLAAAQDQGAAGAIDLAQAAADLRRLWQQEGELGSNGWAFGSEVSRDGRGVLLGNPHFPWSGPNRFWQMHLSVPGQLDVMGAAIGLGAVVQIGFNRDVAWTHTVSTGRRFTLHALKLLPGEPYRVEVDGLAEPLLVKRVAIQVLGPDGRLQTREREFWRSRHGPLVVLPGLKLDWTADRAWALQDANTGNVRATDTWLAMGRATRVEDIRLALGRLGLPWVNTIATDRRGQALYADVSVVPDVSAERLRRCAPRPDAEALLASAGLALLDGSRSDCDWNRASSSPLPGLTPIERLPVLLRRDFVQNSNDSYWLSNPAQRPGGISPLVGPTHVPQRLRTRAGLQEIADRLDGSDGLAPDGRIGVAEVQAMLAANRNFAARLVLGDLLADCRRSAALAGAEGGLSEPSRAGCQALAGWAGHNRPEARGAHLFREWWRLAREVKNAWRLPFNPEDAVATPAGLRLDDPAVRSALYAALDQAVGLVRSAGFALDAPLADLQRRQVAGQYIAIPGGDEFEGVLNKVETQGAARLGRGGYAVNYGSSYLQAVGFDDRGPVAHGLLTYGQSADPALPWAFDQLPVLGQPVWPRLPFHPEEIAAKRVGPVLVLELR